MKTNLYIKGAAGISSIEPDYKDFIQDAGLRRRMSRVIRMSVASSIMAMSEANEKSFDAIVTGTGWGCLADTEKPESRTVLVAMASLSSGSPPAGV